MTETESVKNGATYFFTVATVTIAVFIAAVGMVFMNTDCDLLLWAADYIGSSPNVLAGQVVWITGASGGIGEALAYALGAAGCRLVLSARREHELLRVKQNCLDKVGMKSSDILVVPLDLLRMEMHPEAVSTVLTHFNQIDILVNNAGRSQRALWMKTSLEVDREVLELNTLGPVSLTKAVLPHMVKRQSGHIVVVSSIAGHLGTPGLGSYAASKHALHGFYDTLRLEVFDDNITVSLLCPGPVFSDALKHAFTHDKGQELGAEMNPTENRMQVDRCAYLMAVAIANKLNEAWMSNQPELSYVYFNQYMPTFAKWAAVHIGGKRLKKIKEGKTDLH
ncbi:hypothetical protein C0Q70_10610 [Pomacea canaliculata]|uniref:Ketoreductase domain-containing protein n=1 Tax=Pomacea canaliculata TaxID=400727 RepID=A0A2T7P3N7_POMCA|nr:dehydrogenase/reductase SDR family member 7-like isoform X2 [Pomacea canaliculata]XP_025098161.1 dehydrogenase/reductase SDR family member 7-like isoform X2 [Pomacea canaliculata]XP_025098162.1 dehydrogenase/reductase SDR family member 7-like isoform X2 [Pomacea canaliculata]XP_025098163.1 dehydrogenase/reductase SDR family member 7-like isoform X2 [Pomacea canaliculata]PVD28029.1 hypothetical protein C0Q70_10610 [Pomacea canaliculata]